MKLNRYLDPVYPVFPDKQREETSFRYVSYVIDIVENLLRWQNKDGSWGKKGDVFNQVYHTTQILQCLLRSGFSPEDDVIRRALEFLDTVKKPSIDFRAIFFLYAAMKRYNIDEMDAYLLELKKEQRTNGSLLFPQELKRVATADEPHWETIKTHRGKSVFHALHELHTLSMIDNKDLPIAREIANKSIKYLQKVEKDLNPQEDLYILPDGDWKPDPQFTSWWLSLRIRYELPTEFLDETIAWLLENQKDGGWREDLTDEKKRVFITCFVILDLCFLAPKSKLTHEIRAAVKRGIEWLASNKKYWIEDENHSAIVGRALIDSTLFLYPNEYPEIYGMSIYQHLKERIKLKREIRILKVISFSIALLATGVLGSQWIHKGISFLIEILTQLQPWVGLVVSFIAIVGAAIKCREKVKDALWKFRSSPRVIR